MTLNRDPGEVRSTALSSTESGLLALATLALLVGAVAGLVCALFRLTLQQADQFRGAVVAWAHGHSAAGFMALVGGCAFAAVAAAWLVRRFSPHASGSGIPHVEAVLRGDAPPAPFVLLPVKFVGGILAIGSGLALGREGPSVQMGAVIGQLFSGAFRRDWADCRVLLAAGAGAGLATAFNAPMAGAVFVLEELVQKFEHRIAIAALASSSTAIAVAHLILGDAPDFQLPALSYPAPAIGPLFFALGVVCGAVAVAYNKAVLATLAAVDLMRGVPAETCAAAIGAAAGVIAWFGPECVGGGDNLRVGEVHVRDCESRQRCGNQGKSDAQRILHERRFRNVGKPVRMAARLMIAAAAAGCQRSGEMRTRPVVRVGRPRSNYGLAGSSSQTSY